ncbi:MAG: carbon-nitrogen hydrolase family protein [Rhizobiaceae bacterium]|nr:carbon-nitrogen hydrolase family protein [Rhizobiaceae bacterium]
MKVAAVQMRSKGTIESNCADFEQFVREAAAAGAEYIQTPEMTGVLQRSRRNLFSQIKSQDEDPLVRLASTLSAELGIWLHVGSHAIRLGEEKAANRAFFFGPDGTLIATYDKIHMFDVDLENGESWRESNVYQPGEKTKLVRAGEAHVGLSICYDIRFPDIYRQQALAGAEILTAPSSFTRQTGYAHWHILMRSRAIENGAFMVSAAQGGDHEDGRQTFGHSLIIDPWGKVLAEKPDEEPGIIFAELDLNSVAQARRKIPSLANSRDFVLEDATLETGSINEAAE